MQTDYCPVPSPCFLRQSATIAKVRETFWCVICPYLLRDRLVVVGGRRLGLGPGLVRVMCALPGLFRQFFTISPCCSSSCQLSVET